MTHQALSLRPFIGAKDYDLSRKFYTDFGFEETVLSHDMSVFKSGAFSFYLQKAYVKDWIDNTMLFFEVKNLDEHFANIQSLELPVKYPGVRVSSIQNDSWGREYFVHDPSGILWHIGSFTIA